jgi:hypothetical protein
MQHYNSSSRHSMGVTFIIICSSSLASFDFRQIFCDMADVCAADGALARAEIEIQLGSSTWLPFGRFLDASIPSLIYLTSVEIQESDDLWTEVCRRPSKKSSLRKPKYDG